MERKQVLSTEKKLEDIAQIRRFNAPLKDRCIYCGGKLLYRVILWRLGVRCANCDRADFYYEEIGIFGELLWAYGKDHDEEPTRWYTVEDISC